MDRIGSICQGKSRGAPRASKEVHEARGGLFAGATVTAIALVGYTAMGGAIGAGGLGDLAYRYGYLSYKSDYMLVTVVLLIVLVQLLQMLGDRIVAHYTRHQ